MAPRSSGNAHARGVETGPPEPTERVPLNLIEIILAQGSKSANAMP